MVSSAGVVSSLHHLISGRIVKKQNYDGFSGWAQGAEYDNTVQREYGASRDDKAFKNKPAYVWAYYSYEDYSGTSLVVYYQRGKWYYVTGGHCSCDGLGGQWDPMPFSPKEYKQAVKAGKHLFGYYGTGEDFDKWFGWAVNDIKKKKAKKALHNVQA